RRPRHRGAHRMSHTRTSDVILVRPVVSEKSYAAMAEGRYVFRCKPDANKIEIKKAVEDLFSDQKIEVVAVNTINVRGKLRHRGGGHKKLYRIIDFKRNKLDVPGKVATIEYDPNRSARIALIHYRDGEKRYILAPVGLSVGDMVMAGPNAEVRAGNAMPMAS